MSNAKYFSIESVFHPTDFSESSGIAFNHALRIAVSNRSHLDILHVGSKRVDGEGWSEFPQVRGMLERWDLLEKGSPKEAVSERLGMKVRKVKLGSKKPLAAISNFLDMEPADLIILATQGREGLPRWLEPSVSEHLARRAMIATLFVPAGARGFVSRDRGEVDLVRVLIPVDHKPNPQAAIYAAGDFLRSVHAEVSLVEALFIGDTKRMPEVAPPLGLDCSFEKTARSGKPVDEIIKAANEDKADLIVMATEGHNGFLDALRGSTTEQVLRRAPCPVLAIPVAAG